MKQKTKYEIVKELQGLVASKRVLDKAVKWHREWLLELLKYYQKKGNK